MYGHIICVGSVGRERWHMVRLETRLKYDLQLFAKEGSGGEKTEAATPKKLEDARQEGQVAQSKEVVTAVLLLGLFLCLKVTIGMMADQFIETFQLSFNQISKVVDDTLTNNIIHEMMSMGIWKMILIASPLFIVSMVTSFLVSIAQVKWKPTAKPLQPKFKNMNPISGFKRMLSKDKIMELLKSIIKVSILGYVVYDALKEKWGFLFELYHLSLWEAIALIGTTVIDLGLSISYFFLGIAAVDYFYQRRKFSKDMKMTKQEVKDEYKNSEGDPQIKGRIRQKMREVSQKRMMQALPEADVVITNPTHLAVAIKYDRGVENASAPIVIAKGADYVAEKIKKTARECEIEIVENKPLARMLYHNVELGDEIPQELYQMVAEVLAYVYELKGKI